MNTAIAVAVALIASGATTVLVTRWLANKQQARRDHLKAYGRKPIWCQMISEQPRLPRRESDWYIACPDWPADSPGINEH